ncbi:MAG: hypothetical protein Q9220_006406 [cf. Caloplaca sp. 1 TL-2023]
MSIFALPAPTVRALGSTQVLTDSASLVKELVDNALDAHATSITIDISPNTLDIIQVKDNGDGIAPGDDRRLVCKRHCTSKIRDLEDLANVGGNSLGFRGEALASAVEMSSEIVVSTRIAGEETGVSLKVSHNNNDGGEVEKEDRVSQAVGTSVRVNGFLKAFPVRRQMALKDSGKQLGKVKRMLQAHAIARPKVRFSLRVLKAKNDKGSWMYAPKSDASVADAVVKVIGKKAADQCRWVVWSPSLQDSDEASNTDKASESTFTIEAMIPRVDCDPAAVCTIGQYISVDSRPVSCARGTLKRIIQLFKSYFRSSLTSTNEHKINDPFLCMNLACPPGSYDANVEPAKDDVLFTDSSYVIRLMETFLQSQYGDLPSKEKQAAQARHSVMQSRPFDLLLAKKPPRMLDTHREDDPASTQDPPMRESPSEVSIPEILPSALQLQPDKGLRDSIRDPHDLNARDIIVTGDLPFNDVSSIPEHSWHQSMCPINEAYMSGEPPSGSNSQDSEDEADLRDIRVSNPWTLAKLSVPISSEKHSMNYINGVSRNQQLPTPAKADIRPQLTSSSPLTVQRVSDSGLPSPQKSQNGIEQSSSSPDTFPYPIRRWGKGQREANHEDHRSPDEEQPSSTILDSWVQRTPTDKEPSLSGFDVQYPQPRRDFVQASELPQGTPLTAIPDISQRPIRRPGPRKQPNLNKPFKPPGQDHQHVWFDHLTPSQPRPKNPSKNTDTSLPAHLPHAHSISPPPSSSPLPPGLAQTLDYETRKAAAMSQRRLFLRQQQQQSTPPIKISSSQQTTSSPHANRYASAIATLRSPPPPLASPLPSDTPAPVPAVLDAKDPRAYLIRAINKSAKGRVQLGKLPLETPSSGGDGVRELLMVVRTEGFVESVREKLERGCGDDEGGFEGVGEEEVAGWEERVGELMGGMEEVGGGEK